MVLPAATALNPSCFPVILLSDIPLYTCVGAMRFPLTSVTLCRCVCVCVYVCERERESFVPFIEFNEQDNGNCTANHKNKEDCLRLSQICEETYVYPCTILHTEKMKQKIPMAEVTIFLS